MGLFLFWAIAGLYLGCSPVDGADSNDKTETKRFAGTWSGTAKIFAIAESGDKTLVSSNQTISLDIDGSGSNITFGPAGKVPAIIQGNVLKAQAQRNLDGATETTDLFMTLVGDKATGTYSLKLNIASESETMLIEFDVRRVADR